MTLRSIKKILSVTLSVLFLLQQGGFVFATTNVDTWADLYSGIISTPDEYNVTTALTALPSPFGTLGITANGYSVTGASLTANGNNDPLVNIANAITFGLGNNISGSIVNNGTLNYSGSSLAGGTVTGNGNLNFLGTTVANGNTISQSSVSVNAASTLANNAAISATTFTNKGVVNNNATITGAITNQGTLTSSANRLNGAVTNSNTLNLAGGTVQSTISGTGTTNVTANLSSNYAITQNNFAISNNAYVTQNAALTAAVSNASGSTLEIDPDNLAGSVANAGTLKFNAGGALAQNITGNGLTRFDGSGEVALDDAKSITQDEIKVGTNATLTANASNLSATTQIFNDGQLNLTGGTNANAINGDGAVEFSGTSVINNGAIDQQTGGVVNNANTLENNALITAEITNNSGKELYSTADNLNGAVHNAGSLYLKGGTTQNAIDGDGDLIINTAALSNTYNIAQTKLTAYTDFENSGIVSLSNLETDAAATVSNTNSITVTNNVNNAGTINNQAGATFDNSASTGVINNTGTVNNYGTLNAYSITNDATFNNSSDLSFNDITNNGTFHQVDGTMNAVSTTATFDNIGSFIVDDGNVYLASLTNEAGAIVNLNGGVLNAETLQNGDTITNDAVINTVNFTNNATLSGTGTTNITGDSVNNGSIVQDLVTIANNSTFNNNGILVAQVSNTSGSTLNSDPDNLSGNVANNGTLNLNEAGTLSIDVTGAGLTNIKGDLDNQGSITQADINIDSGVVVKTNASNMTATNDIENEGIINYTGGSTNNTITGNGRVDITGYVTNTGNITQTTVSNTGVFTNNGTVTANLENSHDIEGTGSITTGTGISSNNGIITQDALINNGTFENAGHIIVGTLTNNNNAVFNTNADLITTANDSIVNNGALHFTGGDNDNEITGSGMTFIDGNVQNLADIYTQVQVNTGAHYGTATDVHAKIDNRGTTDLVDANILAGGKISGTGTTNILGDTVNNGSITQSSLNIASGAFLTTNSKNVVAAVNNEGALIWNAGDSNTNVINGSGTLEITGGDIVNNAAISQGNITINGGSLTSNADLLTSVGGIANEADLILDGGTNTNVITGSGDIEFTGTTINNASVNQATITNSGDLTNNAVITGTVTNDGTLSSNGINIVGNITNNASYIITDGDNANNITGTNGTVTVQGSTTNTGVINQDSISIATGANLVASNMTNITTANGIDNAGTLEIQSGVNTNNIGGKTGNTKITGAVTNNSGVSIDQGTIEISTLGTLTAYADDLTTVDGISNTGALKLNNGTNTNAITGTGSLTIIGDVSNNGAVSQDTITIESGKVLNSDASLLATTNGIANEGELNLIGGTNENVISENGDTNFYNDVVNNGTIEQTNVTNDTGTLTNNAAITADFTNNGGTVDNNAAITGYITNAGTINSTADNLVGAIASDGTLNIAGGTVQAAISGDGVMNITDDLVNNYTIAQTTVNNNANMTNNGAITAKFNNSGVVDNSAAITGAITNDGTINSTADNLVGTIASDGILNIAGGTVQNTISGTGEMNITADLVNDYTIAQSLVTNEGNLTNNNTITADDITNSGVITGKASDLVASNEIANEGTLVFNDASTGASVISGAGNIQVTADTILTANNTYTGETLIDGATLTIAGQDNLVSSDVLFANDGLLQITASGSLDNLLKGQAATDNINVQNNADLTLTSAMGEAGDFHKTGTGVMTFAMDSNGYTGNTYVDEGTLIGNTLNINNTVNGAAGTTVKFTDTADANLNEINTLGTFVKSASALLNVEANAFSAAQADINSGIFAANRAITADVLNVNDGATLRGNGNITGTVNVNNGGTIAPGNSIDTLTITGDVNFAAGSTTAIEINETPASDLLVITGNANIDSGANLTVSNENGRYFEWKSFEIVNAGNVAGKFTYDGTITDYDASRIDVEVDYSDPTKVLLVAKRKATDYENKTAGLSRNQSEASKAIDAVSTGFGGDITNALLQIEALGGLNPDDVTLIDPNATLKTALDDVAGALYSNSALATLFNAKTAHVYDRIAKRNPSKGACPNCHDNVWAEYYNQYDKVYSDANSPYFTNNMSGVLAGYDRSSENVLLGVYGGFGKSNLRQNGGSKMDLDDTTLGIYGGYRTGDWLFKGTLFGGVQHYNAKRAIHFMGRTANGSYDGVSLGLDLEGSYSIPVYNWLTVRPFVGWLNNYSHQNAFTETGAGDLNLHVFGNDQFNSQVRLGVQLEGKVNKFSWYGSAAVKQFVGNDYAKLHMKLDTLPNTSMEIISAELGRTYFSGQAGLTYALTDNWSIFGNLDTGLSNKSANCYGNIGVAFTW